MTLKSTGRFNDPKILRMTFEMTFDFCDWTNQIQVTTGYTFSTLFFGGDRLGFVKKPGQDGYHSNLVG